MKTQHIRSATDPIARINLGYSVDRCSQLWSIDGSPTWSSIPHLSLHTLKAHHSEQRQQQQENMLKHVLVPVLAAGALAAPPAYPTTTSASYPAATGSSDFVRFYIGVTGDSAPEGSPFPYDTAEYINPTPSTGYFGHSLGEDWCSGQIVFTRLQVPEPSDYYFSPAGADNSTSIVRR
jgi:hypothetical protein